MQVIQLVAEQPLSFFTDALGKLGSCCCGSIGLIVIVTAIVLLLYIKKKRSHD